MYYGLTRPQYAPKSFLNSESERPRQYVAGTFMDMVLDANAINVR